MVFVHNLCCRCLGNDFVPTIKAAFNIDRFAALSDDLTFDTKLAAGYRGQIAYRHIRGAEEVLVFEYSHGLAAFGQIAAD